MHRPQETERQRQFDLHPEERKNADMQQTDTRSASNDGQRKTNTAQRQHHCHVHRSMVTWFVCVAAVERKACK